MDFADVVRARRMVRNYRSDPVDDEVIRRIVKVVHRTPSAGYSQGHRLIVLTDPVPRKRIGELLDPLYTKGGWPPWLSQAPVLIAVCIREASYHERYQESDKLNDDGSEMQWPVPYWYFDSGAMLVMLQLAAANEGLATGFVGPFADGLREVLDLPDDVTLVGILAVGYAAEDDRVPVKRLDERRLPLAELVQWR